MKVKKTALLTLEAHAAAAGCVLDEFEGLDDDLHAEHVDDAFEVKAVLRGSPNEFPIYLLKCVTDDVKVALQANGPDTIAAGDFVMLPEEVGEEQDDWFALRPLLPLKERNRKVLLIAELLKPHLGAIREFVSSTYTINVMSGIELHLDWAAMNFVAAAASTVLSDGTRYSVRFEVAFSNLLDGDDAEPYFAGSLGAHRWREASGSHLDARERLAFIEAGQAQSRHSVGLASSMHLFEQGDPGYRALEVDAPLNIAALNIEHDLRDLDLSELRLSESFD
jgi:hypothetical protein